MKEREDRLLLCADAIRELRNLKAENLSGFVLMGVGQSVSIHIGDERPSDPLKAIASEIFRKHILRAVEEYRQALEGVISNGLR